MAEKSSSQLVEIRPRDQININLPPEIHIFSCLVINKISTIWNRYKEINDKSNTNSQFKIYLFRDEED